MSIGAAHFAGIVLAGLDHSPQIRPLAKSNPATQRKSSNGSIRQELAAGVKVKHSFAEYFRCDEVPARVAQKLIIYCVTQSGRLQCGNAGSLSLRSSHSRSLLM